MARRAPSAAPKSPPPAPAADFRALERVTAGVGRALNERTPLDEAQELIYDAFELTGKRRVALARKALEISEDCADGYVILAEAARTPREAIDLYTAGIAAGERAIGKEEFDGDETAAPAYARALLAYRREGETDRANELLDVAVEANEHVAVYLTGRRKMPPEPPRYHGLGDENEAIGLVLNQRVAWHKTEGAMDWARRRALAPIDNEDARYWVEASSEAMGEMDFSWLDPNEEHDRVVHILTDHPELVSAIDEVDEIEVDGQIINPRLHVTTHEIVATQLWERDPPETLVTAQRLHRLGFERHAVLHMLSSAVVSEVWSAVAEHKPYDHDRFVSALNALPGSWGK